MRGGCLVDLQGFGIQDKPDPRDRLISGVSLVCFNGKLEGLWQAPGRCKDLVEQIRGNPLFRALRVGKLTLSVLDCLLLDLRTVFPEDDKQVFGALQELFAVAHQVKNAT